MFFQSCVSLLLENSDSQSAATCNICLVLLQPLIHMMGSDDEKLQEAAAGCVRNIRLLAMANTNARLFK